LGHTAGKTDQIFTKIYWRCIFREVSPY